MSTEVTLIELMDRCRALDEVLLVELLKLSSDDIVDRCADLIEDDMDFLITELEELNDTTND